MNLKLKFEAKIKITTELINIIPERNSLFEIIASSSEPPIFPTYFTKIEISLHNRA